MSKQQLVREAESVFNTEMHDPVFEPSPDFNFEEEPNHMTMPDSYISQGDFPLFDLNMQPDLSGSSSSHQQGFCQNPFQQDLAGGRMMPPSIQDGIVNDRADSVTQFFGQVTPPDTDSAAKKEARSSQVQESDAVKRKERARNAANKRHAKSKKTRAGSDSIHEDDEPTEEHGERQAHYREKNRVAAAKCRAKKKNHNDNLEEIHRDEASKNKILKAELMGLRNELAQLKGLTLEHSPDSCRCHGIHEYSMRQASLIACGAAPQYGPSVPSPAQESVHSAETPISESSGDIFPGRDHMSSATAMMSRRPSSFAQSNWMQPS